MKFGDNITVTLEDCMELMSRYSDNHFDLLIADPPYFSGPEKKGHYGKKQSTIGVKRVDYGKQEEGWDVPGDDYFNEVLRVSKHQIIWGINYFDVPYHLEPGRIIWDKVNGESSYSDCEIAYCSMIESVRQIRYMWNGMMQGDRSNPSVMQGNKKLNEKRHHPTQKPTYLYEWLLQKYAKRGWSILDTHLGSGSHAVAFDRVNRIFDMHMRFTACEVHPKHFKNATKWIGRETSKSTINFNFKP